MSKQIVNNIYFLGTYCINFAFNERIILIRASLPPNKTLIKGTGSDKQYFQSKKWIQWKQSFFYWFWLEWLQPSRGLWDSPDANVSVLVRTLIISFYQIDNCYYIFWFPLFLIRKIISGFLSNNAECIQIQ